MCVTFHLTSITCRFFCSPRSDSTVSFSTRSIQKTHESRFQTPADDEHTLTSNKHSRCFETDSIVSVQRKGPSRCPPPHATQKRVREDCDFRHRLKNFEENSFAWRVETDTRRFLRVGFYCRIGNGTNAKMLDKVYNKKGARNRK